jgi:ATP-dependent Clp protease ATP-binding subunit ClpC
VFERYTESARRALFHARSEVSELGGAAIAPEHLLLGVLRQPRGVTARILGRADVDEAALQSEIRLMCAGGAKMSTSVEIPFTEETKRILNRAAAEADAVGHASIGPEHLLLAILSEATGDAARILIDKGIVAPDVRREISGH